MQNVILRTFRNQADAIESMRLTNVAIVRARKGVRGMLAVVQFDNKWAVVTLKTAIELNAGYIWSAKE